MSYGEGSQTESIPESPKQLSNGLQSKFYLRGICVLEVIKRVGSEFFLFML